MNFYPDMIIKDNRNQDLEQQKLSRPEPRTQGIFIEIKRGRIMLNKIFPTKNKMRSSYSEQVEKQENVDRYQAAKDDLAEKTYLERKSFLYSVTNVYTKIFPVLSAATLSFLGWKIVLMTSGGIEGFRESFGIAMLIIFSILSLLGILALESSKHDFISTYYREKAVNRSKKMRKVLTGMLLTSTLSVLGSGLGTYFVVYSQLDESKQIEEFSETGLQSIMKAWSEDSLRITSLYVPQINEKMSSAESWDKNRYRTKRGKILDEATGLTREMNSQLKEARDRKNESINSLNSNTFQDQFLNTETATKWGVVAGLLFIIFEQINFACHKFNFVFKRNVMNEGTRMNLIQEDQTEQVLEVQLGQIGKAMDWIQKMQLLVSQGNGQFFLGQTDDEIEPDSDRYKKSKIGFKMNSKNQFMIPGVNEQKNEPDFYKKNEPVNEQKNELKKSVQNDRKNKPEKEIIIQREVDPGNTHPKFSKRVQPTKYKGVNPTKFKKFVRVIRKTPLIDGKYDRETIIKKSNIAKTSYYKYLNLAIQNGDIEG